MITPPFAGSCGRPLVLRAALRYSASQPPRTDCPNLAASHLCRSIPWAWALNTPQPIQCVIQVHIPGLHSATNPESSKDRGWTTGSTPSTTTTRSRSNCGIRAVRASPAAYVPARVFALRLYAPPARPRVPPCAGVGSAPIVSRLARKGQLEKERNAAFNTAILKENGSILFFLFSLPYPLPRYSSPFFCCWRMIPW